MTNNRKINYEAPALQALRVSSERGFAVSDPWTGGESEPLSAGIYSMEEDY